ncbi:uncharacterized protein [Periplaneta americana]|uniref:uncharacterized protein n=1 Tax=Periplaneta americana TaxID=6978 RepID=UPI0037E913A7
MMFHKATCSFAVILIACFACKISAQDPAHETPVSVPAGTEEPRAGLVDLLPFFSYYYNTFIGQLLAKLLSQFNFMWMQGILHNSDESKFSEENCQMKENAGDCIYMGKYISNINGNTTCNIYTIGDCNITKTYDSMQCIHKCKLPSPSDSGDEMTTPAS